MSDFYNKYPYTDFHELNLDWVIERVKKLTEDWLATQQEWNDTEEQWQQLYNYVHDYFANLDVQDEINNKINQMILDGSFMTIVTPTINQTVVDATTTWLAAHIIQPTTPAIDNTLTIAGAAADAKAAGDAIRALDLNTITSRGKVTVSGGSIAAPLDDFNTYPFNSIYVGYDEAVGSLISNYPADANQNGRFVIMTYEAVPTNSITSVQILIDRDNKMFIRKEWGSWSAWSQLARQSDIDLINNAITSINSSLSPIDNAFTLHKMLLASGQVHVVGGVIPAPLDNFNTYPLNSIYVGYDDATASLIANYPTDAYQTGRFVIMTYEALVTNSITSFQMFIDSNNKIFIRKEWGSWSAWKKITTDNELAYKYLSSAGRVGYDSTPIPAPLDNFNTYPVNSIYVGYDYATSSSISNYPTDAHEGRFTILTLEGAWSNPITSSQIFIDHRGNIFYRCEWGSWSAWHTLLNEDYQPNNAYWKTKSIVWLGTSIPAGGAGPTGTTDNGSYPFKAKSVLGNDVDMRNNAVGSSSLWVLKKSLIDPDTNPYGFEFNYLWERVAKCIGLTVAEKQWMIDHKSNWADAPASLTPEQEQQILHYSYEYLVTPYTDQDRLWIFDFTNNEDTADKFGTYDPDYPFDRYSTRGTLQFLWNLILSANPKSSIFVLGNYYTDAGIHGEQNQYFEQVADDWCLPFFPVYKHVSASPAISITTTGGWTVDGYWDNDLYPATHTLTMKQIFSKDGLHPHSDASGQANAELGRIIGNWINEQAVWFT